MSQSKGAAETASAAIVETDIPARLDALPWGRFHTLVVAALGITWILDGLEVTLAGSVAGLLQQGAALGLSSSEIGLTGSAYLAGAVTGALLFGWLTDRLGRRKLFFVTLGVYLLATCATALSWSGASFAVCRFFVGAGVGGEYAAVNSAIQELIPARVRGWTDIVINGSFWIGAALGAGASLVLSNPSIAPPWLGWRLAFFIGAALGCVVFTMRLWIPESPRWLIAHGQIGNAEVALASIEERFGGLERKQNLPKVRLQGRASTPIAEILRTLLLTYPRRAFVGFCLMAAQAFLYNAVFFTYALILTDFYGVDPKRVGWHILALALGNFLGPLALGRFFDTVGRRAMISATYALSGILLTVVAALFAQGALSSTEQTFGWMVVFFFASAAASSAYLTVGETFPLEIRAMAIAVFYAVGTGVGGVLSPWLFGALIGTGERMPLLVGYALGGALMIGAAVVERLWGVAAEGQPLESVSRPLSLRD
jgi:MFS family permease